MSRFLPGVPEAVVLQRLERSAGNEIESGKLDSPESSAALAVNCFGWFMQRPGDLPPFPGLESAFPATEVEIEYQARFPWSGGRHPWLDAAVITRTHLIGVESKRYEPFRDAKHASLSAAYDRDVWGDSMKPYERLRDTLRDGSESFRFLDAAQLVKHAFGLFTQARRLGKQPALVYLFAEPHARSGKPIPIESIRGHNAEADRFKAATESAEVTFHAIAYRRWLDTWTDVPPTVRAHREALLGTFDL